ncbi:N-acetyl-galactosamine-6-sulfatase (GALNS) [Lentisphaera araneosa HTCC2155]|uniref:N-acetyl-galactosamine-6-sulfatase (GALNS) n=1 Tax=Lentisphaera araneosa HTCC2155 TaxID=313628 RepID=A6DR20_9BACT|nr:sulfatase [Lentisphaera araneosa]EDM25908.1 N-acetyl-galactosamine-6-sulfatase (GALNS) [Lentisphaera araneosa HTCC2155]
MRLLLFIALSLCLNGQEKANVILILADDLGVSDTSLGGSKLYQTPNLERLAKRGVYFTNAYAASPLCSPTRSSILTGQNPARTGFTAPHGHLENVVLTARAGKAAAPSKRQVSPVSVNRLSTEYLSLGKVFKNAGYKTAHFGKWHLGKSPYSPLEHGFDIDIPHWPGPGPAGSFVAPWRYPNFKENYPGEHIDDRLGDEIAKYISENKDQPFFINFWQFSVHAPFNAKQELIDKYRKLIDKNNPQHNPVYAAMVESMDDSIGKVIDALETNKLMEKTIIVFFSDNGGNIHSVVDGTTATSNKPFRGGKASIYEGGTHVPAIVVWPNQTKTGVRNDSLIQSEDLYASILEMAALPVDYQQAKDSISFVPVLKGQGAKRKQVFTYFPHSPNVPDCVPPSAALRIGDWKLIKVFHDNPDLTDRFELYNLANDQGEMLNLASQNPEKVKSMNEVIDQYLSKSACIKPIKNPKYNSKFIQSSGKLKARGHGIFSKDKAGLYIRKYADNQDMSFTLPTPALKAGKYTLQMDIRSLSAKGDILVKGFSPGTKVTDFTKINLVDDGLWHQSTHPFTVIKTPSKVMKFILDFPQGQLHLRSLKILDENKDQVINLKF